MDCSTLSREILESELFGHEKGAFTGAVERHIGRFERANGGTLFLDEVSNIDMAVQAKLLRVLQTRTFERVGGQKPVSVDVRIVAATNRPLADCVAENKFREDLYHRLIVVQIEVPPLRERGDDTVVLAGEFLRKFASEHNKTIRGFTEAAIEALTRYRWPGNVRELENVILQAVVLAKSALLDVSDLSKRIIQATDEGVMGSTLSDRLTEPEKQILIDAIRENRGNIKKSAAALQISRTTLYAKLKKYQIDPAQIH
jgi:DNA-binding NtrC family response regulator